LPIYFYCDRRATAPPLASPQNKVEPAQFVVFVAFSAA
jgi:hypothetical protein